VLSQLRQHVVEEGEAGVDIDGAGAVDLEESFDLGLFGRALATGATRVFSGAHSHA